MAENYETDCSKEKSPQMFYHLIIYCLSFIVFCGHDQR